jgi:lambda repressor-like predicted transcriptional regulator
MTVHAVAPITRRNKLLALRRAHDLARGIDRSLTDAAPVHVHIAHLRALGFSLEAVATARGVTQGTLTKLVHHDWPRMRGDIADAWLSLTPHSVFARAADQALVPSYAAVRRYRALQALGWRQAEIEQAALDTTDTHVWANMLTSSPRIAAARHRALAAAFAVLAGSDGPSAYTRRYAQRRGYFPPLAWDDIDEPDLDRALGITGEPVIDLVAVERVLDGRPGPTPLNRAEEDEAITRGLDRGLNQREIAQLLGLEHKTVAKRVDRARTRTETRNPATTEEAAV